MRALGVANLPLIKSSEEQATFTLSGRLQFGWCCFVFGFEFVALLGTIHPMFLRLFHPFVADRRATARTTVTLSHAATSQKKPNVMKVMANHLPHVA